MSGYVGVNVYKYTLNTSRDSIIDTDYLPNPGPWRLLAKDVTGPGDYYRQFVVVGIWDYHKDTKHIVPYPNMPADETIKKTNLYHP